MSKETAKPETAKKNDNVYTDEFGVEWIKVHHPDFGNDERPLAWFESPGDGGKARGWVEGHVEAKISSDDSEAK